MDTAERQKSSPISPPHDSRDTLADDIDKLRQTMAELFLKEASFTSEPVIRISRQLDLKIIEYMRQRRLAAKKAR